MTSVNPSMRLKVKRDTFFLPDLNGVYFRNHVSSFRMEGEAIDQWIERLMPIFNGEYRLGDLTDGLPYQHRNQVYEIADVLYRNGFVRDVSQDAPHQLPQEVLKKYASQIEFLDHFGNSGAYRFQIYRQTKVLVIGSGPFLISAISALLESGLPKLHILVSGPDSTNRQRIAELEAHAYKMDSEVTLEEITLQKEGENCWREIVRTFDSVLFVSSDGDVEKLRAVHKACREEKKLFLSAVCLQQVGLAGPLVHPDHEGCWESAWRRIHQSAISKDPQMHSFSSTAGALLANVAVFELFKQLTGTNDSEQNRQLYLLNLETLEGNWHSFIPHPLVNEFSIPDWVHDFDFPLERGSNKRESELIPYFSRLTSTESGIFHVWEEGDLKQLPLSQCRIQAVDPLSEGPAGLLPDRICTGLTHKEARKEAGLAGIEDYVSRMAGLLISKLPLLSYQGVETNGIDTHEIIGIGAGETFAEGVCRGLQRCLDKLLAKQKEWPLSLASQVQLGSIEDKHCLFYFQALATMKGEPVIALGEEVSGFPVVWVGTQEEWYGSAGLNVTLALRQALQQALQAAQNQEDGPKAQALKVPFVHLEEKVPLSLDIPAYDANSQTEALQSVLQVLNRNGTRLLAVDLAVEPFLKEGIAGVFGVVLREGVAQ